MPVLPNLDISPPVLVFLILVGLWWAIDRGQFEDIESEGERILREP